MTQHEPRPIYVRVSRAPEVFGISTSTVYRAAKRGEITIHKRGGASFLRVEQIEAWIEGRPTEDNNEPNP